MEKVTGIGGIFFDAKDPERLVWWYEKHLGINLNATGTGHAPWIQEKGPTFLTFTEYEKPDRGERSGQNQSKRFQMTTFRVRNMDAMVAQLRGQGVEVRIRKHDESDDGKTVTIFDPELNAVQLWEPRGSREIKVRPAILADIPLLADMMTESYVEADHPLDRARAGACFAGLLANPLHGAVWVMVDEGDPAGYVALTVRYSMERSGLDAFIDDLFVRPAHRRRGIARAGLKELFAECARRGAFAVHVDVGRDAPAARALYAEHGMVHREDDREQLTGELRVAAKAEKAVSGGVAKQPPPKKGRRGRKRKLVVATSS